MSAHTLHWRVNRIEELMEERAQKEYDDYIESVNLATAAGGAIAPIYSQELDDFRSHVNVQALFQPFLDMPQPESFDDEIAQLRNARQDVADAYNELITNLAANSSNWVSDAGNAFNAYLTKLTGAAVQHMALLEDLETLLTTYRNLLEEAWKAAKQLASGIIEKIKEMNKPASIDWAGLLNLGIATVGVVAVLVDPPAAGIILISRTAAVAAFAQAGNSLLQENTIEGTTLREVMSDGKDKVHNLKSALRRKGATISDTLATLPGLLDSARDVVMPTPPLLPAP